MVNPSAIWGLVRQTFTEWSEDKVPRLGAALAFYTALSIAPLLILALRIAASVFGDDAARDEIEKQFTGLIGKQGGEAIQSILESADQAESGNAATILSLATLLVGASGVFGQLQDSLNTIWEVQPKPGRGIWGFLRDRFLSMAMVLGVAFLLLVSLIVSASLAFLGANAFRFPQELHVVAQILNFVVSLGVFTVIFALIFKLLPDVEISWRDVWLGAAITAVLFTLGKFAIGLYLGQSSMASSYGVAGSLIVMLVWVYYSAQIVFFAAEFTQVYANRYGKKIRPSENAEPVTADAKAEQGQPAEDCSRGPVSIHASPIPVAKYMDAWRRRDPYAVAAVLKNGTYFDPQVPEGVRGPALVALIERFIEAFPDVTFETLGVIDSGTGNVAVRHMMRGTHQGYLDSVSLTGTAVEISGCDVFHLEGTEIRTVHAYFDMATLHSQLLGARANSDGFAIP